VNSTVIHGGPPAQREIDPNLRSVRLFVVAVSVHDCGLLAEFVLSCVNAANCGADACGVSRESRESASLRVHGAVDCCRS
jgi:hypothetical protein